MPSNKNMRRVIARIPTDVRDHLLGLYQPEHALVYAHHITWAYKVPQDFEYPRYRLFAQVQAIHRGKSSDLLICRLRHQGEAWNSRRSQEERPDGKLLHITLSIADGCQAADAYQQFQENGMWGDEIFSPEFPVQFQMTRLEVDRPSWNPAIAA